MQIYTQNLSYARKNMIFLKNQQAYGSTGQQVFGVG